MGRQEGKPWLSLGLVMLLLPTLLSHERARATQLEKLLLMPGPVIEGHADVEDDCDACHAVLSDQEQADLCVACHKEVGSDIEEQKGFHGRLPETQRGECSDCHAEHEGRDKNVVELDEATFDHSMTDFMLRGAHQIASCADCHREGELHREADTACIGCHRADDQHKGHLGESCNDCHTENDWAEAVFDHGSTGFFLTGGHSNLMCSSCHRNEDYAIVGRTCVECHRSDDVHQGRNGPQCVDCHSTSSWTVLTFDHLAVSGFPLDGGHNGLTCQDCHLADDFKDLGSHDCNACHREDDVHEGRNGTDCGSCHRTSAWATVDFDHAMETDFALPVGHANLECTSCHKNNLTDDLPRDCGGCHAGDDVHQGQLGTRCEDCHNEISWGTQIRFDHDLASFPLIGAHSEAACEDCHASAAFHDTTEDCVACHEDDDSHRGGLGTECEICHNPSDWRSWIFDHDIQTDFVLTGAHAGLVCGACHSETTSSGMATPQDCNACHDRDDPHLGRFGEDCGRCHTTSSFSEIRGL